MRQTAQLHGIEIKEIGIDKDHVHLLVSVNPSISPSKIAHALKGASAYKLFRAFPWLKSKLWGGHLWSPAYFFDSVGEQTYERLENYVRNQGS
jgi:putative transposase